jgi:hypothetical protein
VTVSRSTMGRALGRLGLSRKKRPSPRPNATARASSKRAGRSPKVARPRARPHVRRGGPARMLGHSVPGFERHVVP